MLHAHLCRSLVRRAIVSGLALASTGVTIAATRQANAAPVIRRPGLHPAYSVELEPHLLLQWSQTRWGDEGFGPGLRVNIPFLDNGPIEKINNNMAIGFGLDWSTFNDVGAWCYDPRVRSELRAYDCDADAFWLPVVLQWNFFLTDIISVFGEPGFAIAHYRWDSDYALYDYSDSDTDLRFVFWGGGRFLLGDTVSIVARIGSPYLSVGVSFLL
jgi:hypothetical protein